MQYSWHNSLNLKVRKEDNFSLSPVLTNCGEIPHNKSNVLDSITLFVVICHILTDIVQVIAPDKNIIIENKLKGNETILL